MQNGSTDTAQANALHSQLLELHRVLLQLVRGDYEREHGPVGGPGALLQLVTGDPAFAWLRPLSMLLVEMDDAEVVARAGGTRRLVEAVFAPGNVFSDRYGAVSSSTPEVTRAHAEAMRLLEALPR
ncbi:MAG: uncharacterized protein JWO86_6110 [Myxococcaceae bacterium]|nr:uncharacterized protein [Myxococcaceae bacterium]